MAVLATTSNSDRAQDLTGRRVRVGRFSRYGDAKRAMDSLRVARIPQRRITLLGRDMRWNPPLSGGRSAALGGTLGGIVGAGTALLLWALGGLASGFTWFTSIFGGGIIGAALGLLAGIVVWRLSRDRGIVPETGSMHISEFDVLVEEDDASKARDLLGV